CPTCSTRCTGWAPTACSDTRCCPASCSSSSSRPVCCSRCCLASRCCFAVVAVLGDQTGYFIGRRIGPALFKKEDSRFFKQHHVTESHAFFEKYGPAAIILARFMPFVRPFPPGAARVSV